MATTSLKSIIFILIASFEANAKGFHKRCVRPGVLSLFILNRERISQSEEKKNFQMNLSSIKNVNRKDSSNIPSVKVVEMQLTGYLLIFENLMPDR